MHRKPTMIFAVLVVFALFLGALFFLPQSLKPATQTAKAPLRPEMMGPPLIIAVNMNGKGNILVNRSKRVLYIFDKDSAATSACYGECAKRWPPLIVSSAERVPPDVSGTFGTIVRSDGGVQATYNAQPLYFFADDVFPGDMKGDGSGGVWHTVHVAS